MRLLTPSGVVNELVYTARDMIRSDGGGGVIIDAREMAPFRDRESRMLFEEKRYRDLVGSLGDGLFVLTRSGTFTFANDALAAMMLQPAEPDASSVPLRGCDMVGMSLETFTPPGRWQLASQWFQQWSNPRRRSVDTWIRTLAGVDMLVELVMTEVEGSDDELVGTIRDVTKQRRTEDLLRIAQSDAIAATEARRTMIHRISHELRTPLHAILGFAELLSHEAPPENAERIEQITQAAERLQTLVEEVQKVNGSENTPTWASRSGPLDIDAVLHACAALIAPAARKAGDTISMPKAAPFGSSSGDPEIVTQILMRFLQNAVAYGPAGGTIHLTAADRLSVSDPLAPLGSLGIRFSVADSGPGIPDHDAERVFEPFIRGPAGEAVGSAGLGLSVARNLAAGLGGAVGVDGSLFWLDLPPTDPGELSPDPGDDTPKVSGQSS